MIRYRWSELRGADEHSAGGIPEELDHADREAVFAAIVILVALGLAVWVTVPVVREWVQHVLRALSS